MAEFPTVNFGLAGGPELPMRARPFPGFDPVGAMASAAKVASDVSAAQEQVSSRQRNEQDRRILTEGMRAGTIDLFTPTGVDNALKTLRGQLSLDTYTRLADRATQLREVDARLQKTVRDMNELERKQYTAGIESAMPFMDALMRQYRADVEQSGEASALANFDERKSQLVANMRDKKMGPNTPMFNEEVLASLSSATPDVLPGIISASKYQADVARNASLLAAAGRMPTGTENFVSTEGEVVVNVPGQGIFNAETREPWTGDPATLRPLPSARGGSAGTGVAGAGVTTVRGTDGNQYKVNSRTGVTEILNRATGQYEPLPGGIPPDVRVAPIGSAAEAQMAQRADRVVLTPEESARLSRISRLVRLNVPPFGQGEAGTNARNSFYKGLLADIDALGQGDTEAAIKMAMATASRKTRENIIQRDTVLRSEEDEAKILLGKIEQELKTIGGPASPFLREKWNTVETRIFGNPTFSKLNLYMTQFVDTMGRLSSNATGAAGTPVAYLNFAKTVLDKDFNLEQIKAFTPAFNDLLNARREGVKNAFTYLNELGVAVPGAAAPAGTPTAPAAPAGGVTPAPGAAARPAPVGAAPGTPAQPAAAAPTGTVPNAERIRIITAEHNAALERLRAATDEAARTRALGDARATRSELARLGVQLPEPGAPVQSAPPAQPSAEEVSRIRRALRDQNMPYEPDLYDYRIGADGKVLRRRKVQ